MNVAAVQEAAVDPLASNMVLTSLRPVKLDC